MVKLEGRAASDGTGGLSTELGASSGERRRNYHYVTYVASFGCGIAIWYVAAKLARSNLFPTPGLIVRTASSLASKGVLLSDIGISMMRVGVGFFGGVSVAVPVGLAMAENRWIRGALEPWVQFFRAVPPLALIPLVIILLGIGELPKFIVIGLAAFLPTTVAVYQGVTDVDVNLVNAARVLGASRPSLFVRVVIPAASPMILTGMRIALGNAWATLVAAELIASTSGLGYMASQGQVYFDVPEIYLAVVLIGILGVVMDRILYLTQQRLTSWQDRR
ncbi:MAG: ABC transporter permease [Actinomycetota bacterium]|nr:ABC transporter permease [Actinomycetota bacterium]